MIHEVMDELGSAILNYDDNNIEMIGFYSPEMLELGLQNNYANKMSHGIYPKIKINLYKIKDNFTLIIKDNNKFISKYNFKPILKDTVDYKDNGTNRSKIFTIRKCIFNDSLFNYKDRDKSLRFHSLDELKEFFFNEYNQDLILLINQDNI